MRPHCLAALVGLTLALADVPTQLSDQEFWSLTQDLSEPGGYFRSDNVVSDEMIFPSVVPDLQRTIRPGGVYLGVGPEQNFTYIAAIKPRIAFILDIRRGNFLEQLMYKALFDLSADRVEFVSRLFSKQRPDGLTAKSTAAEIMSAYWSLPTSDALFQQNLKDMQYDLVTKHGFKLEPRDWDEIKGHVYWAFYWYGPGIRWGSTTGARGADGGPTYADLMKQTDATGTGLSYLASDAAFAVVKNLEANNAIVPVVGDFAGPTALRAIGSYVREQQATVSVFYLDEVEPYLRQTGTWQSFCANAATLPIDAASVFIRPPVNGAGKGFFSPTAAEQMLFSIASDVRICAGG
jgi:hypothetical protein